MAIVAPLTLAACATDFAAYEPPTTGTLSKLTVVNTSEDHSATLTTFDDGLTCTGGRRIHFDNEVAIPAGDSRSATIAAGREFVLFVRLNKIEEEEYGVELGATGRGPAPVISRSLSSIGCIKRISFPVEQEFDYQAAIYGPDPSGSCSVRVSKRGAGGFVEPISARVREVRETRDEFGSYCEPLDQAK